MCHPNLLGQELRLNDVTMTVCYSSPAANGVITQNGVTEARRRRVVTP